MNKPSVADVRLIVLFDGKQEELDADFVSTYLASPQVANSDIGKMLRLQRIDGGNQFAAWKCCFDLVQADLRCDAQDGDIFYFLENDYLHQPDWIRHLVDLLESPVRWDILSMYDHPDKYPDTTSHGDAQQYRRLSSKIFVAGERHWRTVPSTCGSFLMSKRTLERDGFFLKLQTRDYYTFAILVGLFRRRLLSPLPALATHCAGGLLAPCVDWAAIAENTRKTFFLDAASSD